MTFDELIKSVSPCIMTETFEGLGEAKRILHLHADEFSGKEREKIAELSASLMGQMSDLLPYFPPDSDDDDDSLNTIYIPAEKHMN
jgi:hypothetical protein